MTRPIDTGLSDALDEPVVRPFLALRVDLPDAVYVWTGVGRLSFADADGTTHDWIGAGGVGTIDTIGEATDGSATGIRATLLQVPGEFRDDIAAQAVPGVKFDVGLGALNESYQTVDGFAWLNRYKLDNYKITDAGATLSVEITGENRSIDQKRPAIKRFTDEYQQRMHPGDVFFQYVPQLTEVSILWAKAEIAGTPAVGGAQASTGSNRYGGGYNY